MEQALYRFPLLVTILLNLAVVPLAASLNVSTLPTERVRQRAVYGAIVSVALMTTRQERHTPTGRPYLTTFTLDSRFYFLRITSGRVSITKYFLCGRNTTSISLRPK